MLRGFVLGLSALAVAGVADAAPVNLLVNGGFEQAPAGPGIVNGRTFGTMPGQGGSRSWDVWSSENGGGLPGWATQGNGVEVQTRRTIGGADPVSGDYYVELDSHPHGPDSNSTILQTVSLGVGTYALSYWYQPRTNRAGDNGLEVLWDGDVIGTHDERSGAQAGWVQFFANLDVTAAGDHALGFRATGLANTTGALLDDVALTQTPIPAALPLLGAGFAGLAFWRRRQRRA
ncbi:MAG: hypothetical protein AAFX81_09475 [Pseudomonadota bacterium]